MGKETVDNHEVTIATEGTGHVARSKPAAADSCYTKMAGIVRPDNFIATTELGTGKTTKTLINGHAIWTKAGKLDKSPSNPEHIGVVGGTNDHGAYRLWASAKTYSKDLIVEKNGVVRTHDETHQNRMNCEGFVDASNAHAEEDKLDDKLKKRCTIIKVTGHCRHKGEPPEEAKGEAKGEKKGEKKPKAEGAPRELGPTPEASSLKTLWASTKSLASAAKKSPFAKPEAKPAEAKPAEAAKEEEQTYLAVYGGDVITLEATRVDISTPKPTTAKCAVSAVGHTHWLAVTTGNMVWIADAKDTVVDHVGDKWTLEIPGGKTLSQKKGEVDDPKEKTDFRGPGKKDAYHEENAARRQRQKNAHDAGAKLGEQDKTKLGMALELSMDLAKAYQIWMLYASPPTCIITARACGGAKVLKVQIFPEEAFEFDIFSETIKAKLAWIKGVKTGFEWVSKNIGSAGGVSVPFNFEFLQNPNVKLKIAYKELTADKNGRRKCEVRPAWTVAFSFEPFILVELGIQVSLFKILAVLGTAATPAASAAIDWLGYALGKLGIEGFFYFRGALEITPDVELGVDEYGELARIKVGEVELKSSLDIGFEAKAPSFNFHAGLFVEGKVTLGDWKHSADPKKLFEFKAKGRVQFGARGAMVIDFVKWLYDKPISREFEWRPECLRFPHAEAANLGDYYCPMPESGTTAKPDAPEH